MPREFKPQVVSANDLLEGDVVYLRDDGGWSRNIADASIADTSEAAHALLAKAAQPDVVVGPYLLEVEPTPSGPQPLHFRERFRLSGPSVPSDFRRAPTETATQATHSHHANSPAKDS